MNECLDKYCDNKYYGSTVASELVSWAREELRRDRLKAAKILRVADRVELRYRKRHSWLFCGGEF